MNKNKTVVEIHKKSFSLPVGGIKQHIMSFPCSPMHFSCSYYFGCLEVNIRHLPKLNWFELDLILYSPVDQLIQFSGKHRDL